LDHLDFSKAELAIVAIQQPAVNCIRWPCYYYPKSWKVNSSKQNHGLSIYRSQIDLA